MSDDKQRQITRILNESGANAAEELLPFVYAELRSIARHRMSAEKPGQTLQATALVHEAYLRLLGNDGRFENRRHFFAAAAEAMRRILIERARQKAAQRHGGEWQRTITPAEELGGPEADPANLLDMNAAIARLEAIDAQMAMVVKLRYFAGMTVDEVADALETSPRSVNRSWTAARAWLNRELAD